MRTPSKSNNIALQRIAIIASNLQRVGEMRVRGQRPANFDSNAKRQFGDGRNHGKLRTGCGFRRR